MSITLREITMANFRECLALTLDERQKNFVASNVYSLAEAKADGVSDPRAIYADEQLVGFIMYDFDTDEKRGYITRLMVDKGHQGHGYGRAALQQVIDRFKANPDCREIYTSVAPENDVAKGLYVLLGFTLTGEVEDGEAVLRMPIAPTK